jgi:HAD superfamily hydrolase (TIGR01484 family)
LELAERPYGDYLLRGGPTPRAALPRKRQQPAAGWRPKLVALDVDGTIVSEDDTTPEAIRTALGRAAAAGVPIVLVTGRSWLAAKLVLDDLALPWPYCVCNNGATVLSHSPLKIVHNATFDARPIMAALRHHPTAVVAVEEFGRGYRCSGPFPDGELHGEISHVGWDELTCGPVSRLILRDPAISKEDFVALCVSLPLNGLSYFVGQNNWLDIASAETDKAAGLKIAADRLGVAAADVLALGDGLNDLEMLAWAGRGVALGQAQEELKQVAAAVTGRFEDGGTAEELNRWF